MKLNLIKKNYSYKDKESIANMFIIGNGHLGYKGTLEEETKDDKVTFNVIGIYDQYKDKWHESLNLFNPLFLEITINNEKLHYKNSLSHKLTLNISEDVLERKTEFKDLILFTKRLISIDDDNLIEEKIVIEAKNDINFTIKSGIDYDVYDINGPHYKSITPKTIGDVSLVKGITNEGKEVYVALKEISDFKCKRINLNNKVINYYDVSLKKGDVFELYKVSYVSFKNENDLIEKFKKVDKSFYYRSYKNHVSLFKKKFNKAKVIFAGDKEAKFALNYSIYELLILGNSKFDTSIPARGLSGQVYKGAIFWDTEIFMLPFFMVQDKEIAKSLIRYRINTLPGAMNKAKRFGYDGAFYAWESQEDGIERCSLYNVSDSKTNKPIRTYFADKQIHISADILYALNRYVKFFNETDLLLNGGIDVGIQIFKFYFSYAKLLDGKYHFYDVVGPDEYHERVNDNAFTNYHIYFTLKDFLEIVHNYNLEAIVDEKVKINDIKDFIGKIYLPKPNDNGIIEQFSGYFSLEDVELNEFKKRITDKKAYLGGENGLATKTRIIKQADVVTLLALYSDRFNELVLNENYHFYKRYTEHGSSLSNSMYSLLAIKIGELEEAYQFFKASASIDLLKNQKNYAGGIYIGGTHPASNGGAYLAFVYGFLGFKKDKEKVSFDVKLPSFISDIKIEIFGKTYKF